MPSIDSKRLPLWLKRSCTDVLNQLTEPQQAPTSSIPGIQVCKSRAGAVLHAQHLTFLEGGFILDASTPGEFIGGLKTTM
ncbi:unnamed protein product [Prunus armeniaca]